MKWAEVYGARVRASKRTGQIRRREGETNEKSRERENPEENNNTPSDTESDTQRESQITLLLGSS